jgi:Thioredoxin-like
MRTPAATKGLCALALLASLSVGRSMAAQEIPWMTDYAQARALAQSTNRPLLLSFGAKNCVHCNKLYETTLRDPIHVGVITHEFVCLKVESDKDEFLTNRLKITVFPTLVFAAPDGTILHHVEGLEQSNQVSVHIDEALRLLRIREEAHRRSFSNISTISPWQSGSQSPYSTTARTAPESSGVVNRPPPYWYPTANNSTPTYPALRNYAPNYFQPSLPSC